jgi:hypothetical protein
MRVEQTATRTKSVLADQNVAYRRSPHLCCSVNRHGTSLHRIQRRARHRARRVAMGCDPTRWQRQNRRQLEQAGSAGLCQASDQRSAWAMACAARRRQVGALTIDTGAHQNTYHKPRRRMHPAGCSIGLRVDHPGLYFFGAESNPKRSSPVSCRGNSITVRAVVFALEHSLCQMILRSKFRSAATFKALTSRAYQSVGQLEASEDG